MTEIFSNLAMGFSVALAPSNLMFALAGCLVGTLIGVLPGLGPVATMAMLLPLTFYAPPEGALIMLAGIYYGAQYGGSTTAILVNLPGESSSAVTCIDGYQMARQGRAGSALAIAALGSFFAGTVATVLIALFAPGLSQVGLAFQPADYFSLMVLGLVGAMVLAHGSLIKAFAMVALGLLLGLIGTDVNTGVQRFAFGIPDLSDGIDFVPLAMGIFGLSEIIMNLSRHEDERTVLASTVSRLWPSRSDFARAWPATLRGTALGSVLGILPGGGALLSSFAAYTLEKKLSKHPQEFGRGAVEGVAGPESANNAGAQTSFIPMLTLGIPSNVIMAMLIGAMTMQGIAPGPQVMTERPQLFWGMIASMWVGNLMLVVINLPLIGIWIKLLSVPYRLLYPAIVVFCAIGVYSVHNSTFDVGMTAFIGLVGYALIRVGCEPAPLALGFVLGPMMEENLRRAMLLSRGDPMIFLSRPISLSLLIVAVLLLATLVLPSLRSRRETVFQE
ncbi:tripartite tricarboxylate transporter permease [Xanthobacter aminoxidans]|uniref:Tripartite tricarboxylate transporter permease n=1 Tax=Xanthobacter aminoxidans TaxID=186280 RepID=A0ABW6ZQZ3_9HYPH|nr:tripartite tricarboxylate transporter permease [Xanthobacter aminoxidans]MCL8383497.1 tripartite tricarboxylate transporter permease [Xanthobacter aminoxidans]